MLARICVLATALTALATAAFPTASALADGSSGGVSATITVAPPAVRSITVSPAAIVFGGCQDAVGTPAPDGLTMPHGTCHTPDGTNADAPITITNGDVASHIEVSGGDAVPTDNGQHWTLCGTAAFCSDQGAPGPDQFSIDVRAVGNSAEQPRLGTAPACDEVFQESGTAASAGCAANPGQVAREWLRLTAPDNSTDTSTSFVTTVTWLATP